MADAFRTALAALVDVRGTVSSVLTTGSHTSRVNDAAFETAGTALCVVDVRNEVVQANHSFRRTLGDVSDLTSWAALVVEFEGRVTIEQGFVQVRADPATEVEFLMGLPVRGEVRWFHVSLRATRYRSTPTGLVVCALTDITAEYSLRQRYLHESEHDQLTGLLNRRGVAAAAGLLRDGGEAGDLLAVLMCDLDDFKLENDRNGHAAGDHLLEQVAERLRQVAPEPVVVGRLGGDEFVILGHCRSIGDAEAMAEAVVRAVGELVSDGVRIALSVGLAHDTDAGPRDLIDLMRAADEALFRAKASGKGRWSSAS